MMNTVASLASAGCLVFASSPESVQAAQYAPLAQMQVLPTSQGVNGLITIFLTCSLEAFNKCDTLRW